MMKRWFDAATSLLGLAILAPAMGLVAVAIWLEDRGPALFRQRRVGRYGQEFTIYKFRSMRQAVPGTSAPQITASGDPRITRVGRVLRKLKLDELPQLWNVLRGDMSLVGPRPEAPRYVALYTPAQRKILDYRPGITCPASLEMLDEEGLLAAANDPERLYVEELMPQKLAIALRYAEHATLGSDLKLIARTVLRVMPWSRLREVHREAGVAVGPGSASRAA